MRRAAGKSRFLAAGAAAIVIVALAVVWVSRSGDHGRGPAPLPPGAQALALATDPPLDIPSGGTGCQLLGLEDVLIARQGGAVVLIWAATGDVAPAVWPYGFSARLLNGRAEIVSPDGHVIGRGGDSLGANLGSWTSDDRGQTFHFCSVSGPGYQWWPSAP